MNLQVIPGNALNGKVFLPGDKSISHRAALFAALADGQSHFDNFLVSGVTKAMLAALKSLGVAWKLEGNRLLVTGSGPGALKSPDSVLDCGNSGTTMRLLAGALAAAGIPGVLDGTPGLRNRPMRRIVEPLQEMGVPIQAMDGKAPLELSLPDRPLRAIDHTLPVASAQVKSCLLLAALSAQGTTTLREPGPSRDHTERMLAGMGIDITSEELVLDNDKDILPTNTQYITKLIPPSPLVLKPMQMNIPADISSAAFLIVAGLITPKSQVVLPTVGLNPRRTGLLEVLLKMGADINIQERGDSNGEIVGDLVVRSSELNGTHISGELVVRMIDEFPAFSIAAAFAEGESVVSQAEELRYKESDRITALCAGLRSLGISAQENQDGFIISGSHTPQGGVVDANGDHRLGMAFATAGLAAGEPITVQGAQVIAESFPEFTQSLTQLGANLEELP